MLDSICTTSKHLDFFQQIRRMTRNVDTTWSYDKELLTAEYFKCFLSKKKKDEKKIRSAHLTYHQKAKNIAMSKYDCWRLKQVQSYKHLSTLNVIRKTKWLFKRETAKALVCLIGVIPFSGMVKTNTATPITKKKKVKKCHPVRLANLMDANKRETKTF